MDASELDYELPERLIAQAPPAERDAARMLWLQRGGGQIEDRSIRALPALLEPSLIVLNDTRVIPARLHGRRPSGGKAELLLVERLDAGASCQRWLCLGRASKTLQPGAELALLDGRLHARVQSREGGMLQVQLRGDDVEALIATGGELPLPPYIRRPVDAQDSERYQTVYADAPGAVAAPTAGLHLTEELLQELQRRGHRLARVTLHVGPGTFAPLRTENLDEHPMHAERYTIPEATAEAIDEARRDGRPVLAVGTTVVRTLEAAARGRGVKPGSDRTALFIRPPHRFQVVDSLLTNFHLPRSTLLALVMAFGGVEAVRRAYAHAVAAEYRFFSYGDAMLITGAS